MFSHYTENKFPSPDHFVTYKNPRSRWHPQGSKFAKGEDRLSRGVPPVREGDELRKRLEGRRILA